MIEFVISIRTIMKGVYVNMKKKKYSRRELKTFFVFEEFLPVFRWNLVGSDVFFMSASLLKRHNSNGYI